jgi:hypothetical protein
LTYQTKNRTIESGVTGRSEIEQLVPSGVFETLRAAGYLIVPREPTELMIRNAWADALAEDAKGVWDCMIEAVENPTKAKENLNW